MNLQIQFNVTFLPFYFSIYLLLTAPNALESPVHYARQILYWKGLQAPLL